MYWVFFNLSTHSSVWLCLLVAVVAALIPDLVYKVMTNFAARKHVIKLKTREFKQIGYSTTPRIKRRKAEQKSQGAAVKSNTIRRVFNIDKSDTFSVINCKEPKIEFDRSKRKLTVTVQKQQVNN
jgi:hypothetical protein